MDIVISKSNRKDKKLKAVIDNKKTIHFGASGYSDYTKNKDDNRKDAHIQRHKNNEKMLKRLDFTPNIFYGISQLY